VSGFWGAGLVLAVAGVLLAAVIGSDGAWLGFLVAAAGGVLLQIAVISTGVSIGMRDRDEKVWARRHANRGEVTL
jgi:hypothetical protein